MITALTIYGAIAALTFVGTLGVLLISRVALGPSFATARDVPFAFVAALVGGLLWPVTIGSLIRKDRK